MPYGLVDMTDADIAEKKRLEDFLERLTGDRWTVWRTLGEHEWGAAGRCTLPATTIPRLKWPRILEAIGLITKRADNA